jgi:hypothetical protein
MEGEDTSCGKRKLMHAKQGWLGKDVEEMRQLVRSLMPHIKGVTSLKRSKLCEHLAHIPNNAVAVDPFESDFFLKNIRNSCYIDSVLIGLLASDSKWICNNILRANSRHKNATTQDLATKIQNYFRTLYSSMRLTTKGGSAAATQDLSVRKVTCDPLRSLLKRYSVRTKQGSNINWTSAQNDPVDFLNLLVHALNIRSDVKYRWHGKVTIHKKLFNAFSITSEMLYNFGKENKTIVIGNDVYPRFVDLSDRKYYVEQFGSLSKGGALYVEINRGFYGNRKLNTSVVSKGSLKNGKAQALQLFSLIIHQGSSVQYGHYVCIFKHINTWYEYDDLCSQYTCIGRGLKSVWDYKDGYVAKNVVGFVYLTL